MAQHAPMGGVQSRAQPRPWASRGLRTGRITLHELFFVHSDAYVLGQGLVGKVHQGITKRGPAPLQAEKTLARGMHVQGVQPHLGTWTQAIRCGNWSCQRVLPMVVPFGAVSMDAPDPPRAPINSINSPAEGIRAHHLTSWGTDTTAPAVVDAGLSASGLSLQRPLFRCRT